MRRSVVAWMVACAAWATATAAAPEGVTTGVLGARLRSAGRAVGVFERRAVDPFEGRVVAQPGVLTLEPGLADIRFDRTGERLTVRPDGGEWLQPALGQIVMMGPESVTSAAHWWEVLLSGAARGVRVVREAPNRYVVVGRAGGGPRDTARVHLDAKHLPARVEIVDATGRSEYVFARWRFEKARGRAAFTQRAARGAEVVRLP